MWVDERDHFFKRWSPAPGGARYFGSARIGRHQLDYGLAVQACDIDPQHTGDRGCEIFPAHGDSAPRFSGRTDQQSIGKVLPGALGRYLLTEFAYARRADPAGGPLAVPAQGQVRQTVLIFTRIQGMNTMSRSGTYSYT